MHDNGIECTNDVTKLKQQVTDLITNLSEFRALPAMLNANIQQISMRTTHNIDMAKKWQK